MESSSIPAQLDFTHSKESKMILQLSMVQACTFRYYIVCHTITLFLVFTTYTATGGELTPKRVFTTLAMIDAIFLSFLFSELILLKLFQGGVAISRITVSMGWCYGGVHVTWCMCKSQYGVYW